jgi:hypothetical protein
LETPVFWVQIANNTTAFFLISFPDYNINPGIKAVRNMLEMAKRAVSKILRQLQTATELICSIQTSKTTGANSDCAEITRIHSLSTSIKVYCGGFRSKQAGIGT